LSSVTFPLIPRRRVLGLAFGGLHSLRRGPGSDVAGSRPYRPGDDVKRIDWNTSARLSHAWARDEFVVREHFAEEAPRAVVLCDRRPSMSLFPEPWPWLQKPEAIRHALRLIGDSVAAARGLLGYLDDAEGTRYWRPPRSERELGPLELERPFAAPEDTLERGFEHLVDQRRDLPAGTFVFVVSDFLVSPSRDLWLRLLERRFELVPVVVQDPLWERTFPDVSGTVLPFQVGAAGLTAREVAERREANERRFRGLVRLLRSLDAEPAVVSSHAWRDVVLAFLTWADQRQVSRGRP
jgi:uncharacterized protein (DUF58 family)